MNGLLNGSHIMTSLNEMLKLMTSSGLLDSLSAETRETLGLRLLNSTTRSLNTLARVAPLYGESGHGGHRALPLSVSYALNELDDQCGTCGRDIFACTCRWE